MIMRQVYDYVIMDTFLKNDLQCISMGAHSTNNNEIALINEIEKDSLISNSTFNALVRHLTNLQFSNSDSKYTLVTLYNEGVPFPIFMQNYQLQNDERKALLLKILDKIAVYNELPDDLLSLLIDENQIIISDSDILLNEIINLEKYDTSVTYQDSLKIILEKVLDLCDCKPCYDINDYLTSDKYYQASSLIEIIDSIKTLVENVTPIEDDENQTPIEDELNQAPIDDDVNQSQTTETNDANDDRVIQRKEDDVVEPFIYKFDVELDDVPSADYSKNKANKSNKETPVTAETAINDDIKSREQIIETALIANKAHTASNINKTTKKNRRMPYKTRAQRRRRLIWLIVIVSIILLLKMMWPQ